MNHFAVLRWARLVQSIVQETEPAPRPIPYAQTSAYVLRLHEAQCAAGKN